MVERPARRLWICRRMYLISTCMRVLGLAERRQQRYRYQRRTIEQTPVPFLHPSFVQDLGVVPFHPESISWADSARSEGDRSAVQPREMAVSMCPTLVAGARGTKQRRQNSAEPNCLADVLSRPPPAQSHSASRHPRPSILPTRQARSFDQTTSATPLALGIGTCLVVPFLLCSPLQPARHWTWPELQTSMLTQPWPDLQAAERAGPESEPGSWHLTPDT